MSFFSNNWIKYTLRGSIALFLTTQYVGQVTMCVGGSMLPTFNTTGDFALVEYLRVSLFGAENIIKRGDIIVAYSPLDPSKLICKRVLALEGDQIFADSTLFAKGSRFHRDIIKVPKGHVWIQGDNINNSTDSRCYGPIPLALIKGRVLYKIWPNFQKMESTFF